MHGIREHMKIRRDVADDLFSKLVRERANWCCETCGKYFPEDRRQGLHCSHIFSRRHKAIRWHPDNAIAECFGCHQKGSGNPVEHFYALETILGRGKIDRMRIASAGVLKVPSWYKKEIVKKLKSELTRVLAEREQGNNGRIEFFSPY